MLEKQQTVAGKCFVLTVLFDHYSKVLHDRADLEHIQKLTAKDCTMEGCTALLGTVGGAILHIGNIYKYVRLEDVPEHTVFIITTDGQENAS